MNVFDAFQIPYSAVQRDHEDLIAEAADKGAGTLIRGGAARGAASEEKNWRTGPLTQQPGLGQRNWQTSGIEDLLASAGMSTMEFVLRFTLSHPGLSTTIVGTANPAHLATNIAIAEKGPLPVDLYEEAKKRLPQLLTGLSHLRNGWGWCSRRGRVPPSPALLSRPSQDGDGERAGLRPARWTWTLGLKPSSSMWRIP
jgi:hypothetical protein